MTDRETHQMRLERTYESGAEEWLCPSCGRKFVMQWPPRYKRIVLHEGDQNAAHTGGKGGLHMGRLDVRPDEPPALHSRAGPRAASARRSQPARSR